MKSRRATGPKAGTRTVTAEATRPVVQLGEQLGVSISDAGLFGEALTHASAVAEMREPDPTYQRLEFLGDRVLGLVVADMLHHEYPEAEEGELAQRLNALVRGETCADVAEALQLGPFVRLGEGEIQSGARNNRAILANVCESIIGALYLDQGWDTARKFVEQHWRPRMTAHTGPLGDAKTRLQEFSHASNRGLPVYTLLERTGPDHAPHFEIVVSLPGLVEASGAGSSKRKAEQAAARAALIEAGVWPADDSKETGQ